MRPDRRLIPVEQSIPHLQETTARLEQSLGPDHPDTLMSRNNLTSAYKLAGDRCVF